VDGKVIYLDELDELNGKTRHTIEIVVDRLKVRKEASLEGPLF
jgi:excinuclease ABC subunit A